MLLQAVMMSLLFSFLILSTRQGSVFLPARDYQYYYKDVRRLYPRP